MKKRTIKYNLIVVMLIVLIPLICSLSIYFEGFSQLNILDKLPEDSTQELPIETPDIPQDVVTEQVPTAPTFKTGMQAVEYAVGILNTNIDFECDIYHTTNAGIGSMELLMKTSRYKNHELLRVWTECSIPAKMGNFYKSQYTDCEKTQVRINYDSSRFDLKSQTNTFVLEDEFEGDFIEEYIETDKINSWSKFFTDVNSNLAREVYFNKTKDKYFVKVAMLQSKLKDSKYADTMASFGAISCDFKTLNMVFEIDQKTGYLLSCTREEVFNIDIGAMEIVTCSAVGKHTYRYNNPKDTILKFVKQDHFVGY